MEDGFSYQEVVGLEQEIRGLERQVQNLEEDLIEARSTILDLKDQIRILEKANSEMGWQINPERMGT